MDPSPYRREERQNTIFKSIPHHSLSNPVSSSPWHQHCACPSIINSEIARLCFSSWGRRALSWTSSRATGGARLARFGASWLDLALPRAACAPKKTDCTSNRAHLELEMATVALKSIDWVPLATELEHPRLPQRLPYRHDRHKKRFCPPSTVSMLPASCAVERFIMPQI